MSQVATAYIDLVGRDKASGVLSRVGKSLGDFKNRLDRLGAAATKLMFFGGLGAGAMFGYAIKQASNLQETTSKFDIVFGKQSEAIKKWGDEFANAVGRSKNQVRGFLAGSQDLFVPLGFGADEAERMSKQVTKLAIDLASFNNTSDADAMNNLQAALTGSGEVMKKYGVIVSEATVAQEALNSGLNPKKLSETEKVMMRLNIIMKGTKAAQGDAIRTADSFANQFKKLRSTVEDAAGSIGELFLPEVTALVAWASKAVKAAAAWIVKNKELVASIVKWGVALLGIAIIVPKVIGMITMLGSAMIFLVANPISLFLIGLAAIVVGLIALAGEGDTFADRFQNSMGRMASYMDSMLGSTEQFSLGLSLIWEKLIFGIQSSWDVLWGMGLQKPVKEALAWLNDKFIELIGFVRKVGAVVWGELTGTEDADAAVERIDKDTEKRKAESQAYWKDNVDTTYNDAIASFSRANKALLQNEKKFKAGPKLSDAFKSTASSSDKKSIDDLDTMSYVTTKKGGPDGYSAKMEGLRDLYTRVQSAALEDEAAKDAKRTADASEKIAGATDKIIKRLDDIKSGQKTAAKVETAKTPEFTTVEATFSS